MKLFIEIFNSCIIIKFENANGLCMLLERMKSSELERARDFARQFCDIANCEFVECDFTRKIINQ